ncbi:MAG: hypothetical protein GJ679_10055 [Rhodobacteraceae bacterium]|nr:hypothetical protein [Paracoccaceae bacterium]
MDMKIAICFFGITRSLTHTIGSIERNILAPARDLGEVRVFAHFFRQAVIDNPRSGERGTLKQDEHQLLSSDWLELEEPGNCLYERDFEGLKKFGDTWKDDFRSLRNLVHQLHSLDQVTRAALAWNPDIVVFARPDLEYHDNLEPCLQVRSAAPLVQLPSWQHWGQGYNDRFAVAMRPSAAMAYGSRIGLAHRFCHEMNRPLHAELLVRYGLETNAVKTKLISARATRVRSNGIWAEESFRHYQLERVLRFPGSIGQRIKQRFSAGNTT